MLAIIGGSALSSLENLTDIQEEACHTPYGMPSAPVRRGFLGGHPVLFLARHGADGAALPHEVNYRANLHALKLLGATQVLGVAAVGGIAPDLAPGMLAVPHQLLDYTWGRAHTFQTTGAGRPRHVDFTHPYDAALRERCLAACHQANVPCQDGGIYAVTQGPRLETAAEIDRLARDGATMVGMSGMPEAILARELELPYTTLAIVVNAAAGRGEAAAGIDITAVHRIVSESTVRIGVVLEALAGGD